jgi:hypothetical protein
MEPLPLDRRNEAPSPDSTGKGPDPQLMGVVRAVMLLLAEEKKAEGPPAEHKKEEKKEKKPDEQVPLFWKLCSAALLSVSALIMVTLYNQVNATGHQLRNDVGQLRNELGQLRTDLVPKDDYNTRIEQMVRGIKEVQISHQAASEAWRERLQEQKNKVGQFEKEVRALEEELPRLSRRLEELESARPRDKQKGP